MLLYKSILIRHICKNYVHHGAFQSKGIPDSAMSYENVFAVAQRLRAKKEEKERSNEQEGTKLFTGTSEAKLPKVRKTEMRRVHTGKHQFGNCKDTSYTNSSGLIELGGDRVLTCISVMLAEGKNGDWKSGITLEFDGDEFRSFGSPLYLTHLSQEETEKFAVSVNRMPLDVKNGECVTLMRCKFEKGNLLTLYFFTNLGYSCGKDFRKRKEEEVWLCGDEIKNMQFWYDEDQILGMEIEFGGKSTEDIEFNDTEIAGDADMTERLRKEIV